MPKLYPDYLYHYTTLDSLAMILSGRKIKFSLLSNLNDPLEGKNPDFKQAERLIYSSSWTAVSQDMLPMWNLYSALSGGRIKLPSDMFDIKDTISQTEWLTGTIHSATLRNPPYAKLNGDHNGSSFVKHLSQITGPDEVRYVNQGKVGKIPRLVWHGQTPIGRLRNVELSHVGLTKSKVWEFEQEWRFRLPFNISFSEPFGGFEGDLMEILNFQEGFVLVDLRDDCFEQLEVTLGPKADKGTEIIVGALIEKFAPDAKCERSEIEIR